MNNTDLLKQADFYLQRLCTDITNRCVGSDGNRAATRFFAETVSSFGFSVECPEFDCIDWTGESISLESSQQSFEAFVSPYSLPCSRTGRLAVVKTLEELKTFRAAGRMLLITGDLAREQLMPKNFPFYNPKEHKEIIDLLEIKRPSAVIAATTRNPELAGGIYPFPLIEDGDFTLPSCYMKEEEGVKLQACEGREVHLEIRSRRNLAKGCNVIAAKGRDPIGKIVLCAHIDAKMGTPGAVDNASGIIVLLLLAQLLRGYFGRRRIELTAINGEDYYSSPGEILYIEENKRSMSNIMLAINIDGAGYHKGKTAYSLYDVPNEVRLKAGETLGKYPGLMEGPPWFQSDHSIFIQNGRPAMAITTENFTEISTYFSHTPKDNPDIIDCGKLVETAAALHETCLKLSI